MNKNHYHYFCHECQQTVVKDYKVTGNSVCKTTGKVTKLDFIPLPNTKI